MYLPARWRGGGSTFAYLLREHYEPELLMLERVLRRGRAVVDAGASTGVYAFTAASLVGRAGRVVAVEPGEEAFSALQRTSRANCFPQLSLCNAALGATPGVASVRQIMGQSNMLGLVPDDEASDEDARVRTLTLDDVMREYHLERLDFLKIDVEGAQELVLRGGVRTLELHHPLIRLEISPAACARLRLHPMGAIRLLEALGYGFYEVDATGCKEANLAGAPRNLLAVHRHSASAELLSGLAA